nr:hypothetical protein [Tanacetum cinerariifolium]
MKVLQAYYATNELPIPPSPSLIAPPTVLLPPPVLPSLLFNPQDFFLPEKILPPQKQAHFLTHSSADSSALPHIVEIGESSHKTPLKLETGLEEARTQIAGLQKKQIGHDDEVVLARVRISTLEMIIKDIQVCYRSDIRSLLEAIRELKNNK